MAFQPVVNTAEFVIQGALQGIPVQNTFYVENTIPWLAEALDDLCEVISDAVLEGMINRLPTQWFGFGVFARDLSSEIAPVGVSLGLAGVPGNSSGAVLPNNCSASFKRSSAFAGRSARGRIYWMGLDAGFLSANENFLSGSFTAAAVADLNIITNAITAEGYANVIVSRYHNGLPRAAGLTTPQTGWAAVTQRVASRRDRLPD